MSTIIDGYDSRKIEGDWRVCVCGEGSDQSFRWIDLVAPWSRSAPRRGRIIIDQFLLAPSDLLLANFRVRIAVAVRIAVVVRIRMGVRIAGGVPIGVHVPIRVDVSVGVDVPIDVNISIDLNVSIGVFTVVIPVVVAVSVMVIAVS